MLTSKAFTDKEPYVTLRVASAIRKAITAMKATPADVVAKKLPAEFQNDALVGAVRATIDSFTTNGEIQLATATSMIADMSDLKMGRGGIEPADTFDNRFIRAVNAGA
jgi:hypothetical protein